LLQQCVTSKIKHGKINGECPVNTILIKFRHNVIGINNFILNVKNNIRKKIDLTLYSTGQSQGYVTNVF